MLHGAAMPETILIVDDEPDVSDLLVYNLQKAGYKTVTARDGSAALQKALANMRELAEAGYKAQADTFAVVSRRVQENIQELKTLLQPKT